MTDSGWLGITIIALVLMVAGSFLSLYALRRYGSESAPRGISFNPRNWRPIYLARDWFTEKKGFWLFIIGVELLCGGPLILVIAELVYF